MTRVIFAPYRICPIGAHIDHQGGAVLGRTINLGTTLEYKTLNSNKVHITSDQLGESKFIIGDLDTTHWVRYAQAAARVLPNLKRGIQAHVSGSLIGAGLSSSASVGLAYLKALADVNSIELSNEQLVHLDYELEHGQLGLQNGLLDPLTIVHGKKNALLFMDTITASVTPIFDSPSSDSAWIVAYSGISRELTKSGFNVRVEECYEAAAQLKSGAQILSDVSGELFGEKKNKLPENLCKRATHFFTEVERVQQGAQAWEESNLELFGQLMNQSCESSIHNYESGSDVLIQLHEIASSTNGIYGSRFSGGGYGGCVVALAKQDLAEDACAEIAEKLSMFHPELPSKVFVAEMGDGLRAERSILRLQDCNEHTVLPLTSSRCPSGGRKQMMVRAKSKRRWATMKPVSAVLLAAGRGKRQRPYTDVTPKPLLEVNGRATLDYVLTAVARAGVERVCIVTNHLEEKIFDFVGNGSKWNLATTFAHQSELHGNGDALLSVPKDWIQDEPVMIVATDYILEENSLLELVNAHKQHNADITVSLKECSVEELMSRSSVDVDSDWHVKRIIEKPKRDEIMSPYAASILFILPSRIWEYLPKIQPSPRGEIEMQSAVQMMIEDGFKTYGLLQPAPQEWTLEFIEKVKRS